MKKKVIKQKPNQKVKRKSKGTNKGTSGMQRDFYANLFQRAANKITGE